jgi:hypothetical protein
MRETKSRNLRDTLAFDDTTMFEETTALDLARKSYFRQIIVDLPNRSSIPVCFSDPARLAQALETNFKARKHCVAEPGLIILQQITAENMIIAVTELYHAGYFANSSPL